VLKGGGCVSCVESSSHDQVEDGEELKEQRKEKPGIYMP
jgi:hypothetical protein